jgi:hypothetical protein
MKRFTLLIVVLLIAVAVIVSAEKTYKQVVDDKYCKRKLSGSLSNSGRTLKVESKLNCDGSNVVAPEDSISDNKKADGETDSGKRMAKLNFELSTASIPSFALRAMAKTTDSVAGFMSRFGFDRIVEYVENGTTAGFQRIEDTVVRTQYLSNLKVGKTWSSMTCTNVDQKDETQPITCSSSLQITTSGALISGMTISATVTPQEVEVENADGITKAKKILTPNSFKLDVTIEGITYSQDNSRIAVGTFILYKGIGQKHDSSNDNKNEERPDDVTANQGVIGVKTDASAAQAGFFSWDKFISVKGTNGTYTSKTLRSSSIESDDNNSDVSKESDEADASLVRVWFAPDDRVTNLLWDPSLGVTEAESSAASIKLSMTVIVLSIVFLFMMML